jgi:hypothetical protein
MQPFSHDVLVYMYICVCVMFLCNFAGVYTRFSYRVFRPALGSVQLSFQRVPNALSTGINRPGHEADHSPPSGGDVKNV